MAVTVEWHHDAKREFQLHVAYYLDEASAEVAVRFSDLVDEAIEEVADAPDRWRALDHLRRAHQVSRPFPFRIIYRILAEDRVRILAVEHGSRDQPWRDRE